LSTLLSLCIFFSTLCIITWAVIWKRIAYDAL
jgi:hypothetical protein